MYKKILAGMDYEDFAIVKDGQILVSTAQLYEIVKIIADAYKNTPEDWHLKQNYKPAQGIYEITYGANSSASIPRLLIPDSAKEKYLHKEALYFLGDTGNAPEELIGNIKRKIGSFDLPEEIHTVIKFHNSLGQVTVSFKLKP
jgi:hypothetical protein